MKQDNATYTHRNVVNLFIFSELDTWLKFLNVKFTLNGCLFWAVKLTKTDDPNKYEYSGYGIGFDAHLQILLMKGK